MKSWQRTIGYVPQQIFLIDDTISSNIAFGVSKENIDFEQVKKELQKLQICMSLLQKSL